jgi:ferredoxin
VSESYRLFNCAKCRKQTFICRKCDRGNIYCSADCAKLQRANSLRRAGKKYQKTPAGQQKHAARQARYRLSEKVTHQGSQSEMNRDSLKEVSKTEEEIALPSLMWDKEKGALCHFCGDACGRYARRMFWRGGRNFRSLKKEDGDFEGNRGRDPPFTSC